MAGRLGDGKNQIYYYGRCRGGFHCFQCDGTAKQRKHQPAALWEAASGHRNRHPEYAHAIQAGILTSSIKECLEALETQKKELEARIAEERLANLKLSPDFVRFWLIRFRKLDLSQREQRQELIDTSINAIYRYDDKMLITFNDKEGTEIVSLFLSGSVKE